MNRQQYRIVFNKQRGQLMAVAETVASQGKSTGQTRRGARRGDGARAAARPWSSVLAWTTALGLVLSPQLMAAAHAQIKADTTAPKTQQPTVLTGANGTPVVNIQTPSAAGVSRNTYSQFDVNAQGAILNNARTDANTQLAGWVQANPWLAKGGARVILNEVNSSAPSQLNGAVEIAGQKAELVIANPSGIQVNGAGFINASTVTLTTGRPLFADSGDGSVRGYDVRGGLVTVPIELRRDVTTDTAFANALAKNWNGDSLLKQAQVNTSITQQGLPAVAQAIGDYSQTQLVEANKLRSEAEQLKNSSDPADQQKVADLTAKASQLESNWGDTGTLRLGAHALLGALGGGTNGAIGAGVSQAAVPVIAEQIRKSDLPPELQNTLIAAAGTAIGAATGGTAGAVTGYDATTNNYLKHPQILAKQQELSNCRTASDPSACSKQVESKYNQISRDNTNTAQACDDATSCRQALQELSADAAALFSRRAELEKLLYQGKLTPDQSAELLAINLNLDSALGGAKTLTATAEQTWRQFRAVTPSSERTSEENDKTFKDILTALGGLGASAAAGRAGKPAEAPAAVGETLPSNMARGSGGTGAVIGDLRADGTVAVRPSNALAAATTATVAQPAQIAIRTIGQTLDTVTPIVAQQIETAVGRGGGIDAGGLQELGQPLPAPVGVSPANIRTTVSVTNGSPLGTSDVSGSADSAQLQVPRVQGPVSPSQPAVPYVKIEDLYNKSLPLIDLSHTSGTQDGVLGEQLAIQVLNEKTGLDFRPLQNASNHGCDGCVVSIQGDTITVVVMDAKSSQAGVDKAKSAAGDPEARLRGWLAEPSIAGADGNEALAKAIQKALDNQAQVKGITVKIGLPAPGTTGTAEFKVEPWPKK